MRYYQKREDFGWKKDLLFSSLLPLGLILVINPQSWFLAVPALISLVFVIYPIFRFNRTREMMHFCLLPVIILTWIYFLAPYLYSSLPVYADRVVPKEFLPEMSWYSGISVIAIFTGYYLSFRKKRITPISSENLSILANTIGKSALIFLGLAVIHRIITYYLPGLLIPFGQLVVLLDFTPVLAICLGLLFVLRGGRSLLVVFPVTIFFIFEILLRISETLTSLLIYMLVALVLIYVFERKKIPYLTVVVLFLVIFPVYNAKGIFRNEAVNRWHFQTAEERVNLPELVGIGFNYLVKSYDIFDYDNLLESVKSQGETRFENITYLGQCVYLVEQHGKELKLGETFWWLPATVIPRIIFPWKPENYHATVLASEYGIRNPAGHSAFNFPMLVEMYINFSFIGMIIFSFFQGVLMKWCLSKASFGKGDLNLLLMVCLLWDLVRVESNITLVFGAIFHSLIIWWILAKIIGKLSSQIVPTADFSNVRS